MEVLLQCQKPVWRIILFIAAFERLFPSFFTVCTSRGKKSDMVFAVNAGTGGCWNGTSENSSDSEVWEGSSLANFKDGIVRAAETPVFLHTRSPQAIATLEALVPARKDVRDVPSCARLMVAKLPRDRQFSKKVCLLVGPEIEEFELNAHQFQTQGVLDKNFFWAAQFVGSKRRILRHHLRFFS